MNGFLIAAFVLFWVAVVLLASAMWIYRGAQRGWMTDAERTRRHNRSDAFGFAAIVAIASATTLIGFGVVA